MLKSRHIRHGAKRTALLAAALFVLVLVPSFARAEDATVTIMAPVRMFQEYRVSASGLQSTFDYEIVPLETGAPLPVDKSGKSIGTISLTRDEELGIKFPVDVSRSDSADSFIYHYTLKPAKEKLEDGLYYVDILSTSLSAGINVYYLELHVQLSSGDAAAARVTPTVHVETWDGPKVADPGWRVGYKDSGTSAESRKPGNEGDNGSSNPVGTTATTATAATTATTTGANASARLSSLAGTGDTRDMLPVVLCVADVGALLLSVVCWRRGRAGEQDA